MSSPAFHDREGPCTHSLKPLCFTTHLLVDIFIEADADVTLHQFGDTLQPPVPYFQELLYNVPGSDGIINCPLLLIQVPYSHILLTYLLICEKDLIYRHACLRVLNYRLHASSAVVSSSQFAIRLNHNMSDVPGIVQFLKALAEIARGATEPSVPPVWHRELLNARDLPRITHTHTHTLNMRKLQNRPKTWLTVHSCLDQGK